MAEIIEIGKAKFEERRKRYCRHQHLAYSTENQSVECTDCGEPISAFKAFMVLVDGWKLATRKLEDRKAALAELEKKHLTLKAAKRVEKAWRSRTMVPTCPHCHEAIFPEDGLGGSSTNKEMAKQRRAFNARGRKKDAN